MEYDKLSDEELRTVLSSYQDLRSIPISKSTRSFLILKLKARERPEVSLQDVGEEKDASPQATTESPSAELQSIQGEGNSERYGLAVNGSVEEFSSKSDALRAMKRIPHARCIKVSSSEPYLTEKLNNTTQVVPKSVSDDKANDYRAPTVPDLNKFRRLVEKNDVEAVREAIDENPRLLVTSSDAPEILKKGVRYNALHCAVVQGCLEVCKLLMDILRGDDFWHKLYPRDPESIDDRRHHLVDLYLNTCEGGNHETPLHLACKYGHEDIVEYLLCFSSMLDTSAKNKYGESPSQVTLNSSKISSKAKREKICHLLSEPSVYFVRVLRAPDNSLCPSLEKPSKFNNALKSKTGSPYTDKIVSSYAGPMSPRQAKELYREWRSPSRAADQHIKRSDPDRGLERVGRKLSHQQKVPWSEFWEFLKCSCDLSKEEGRKELEEYLRGVWAEERPQSTSNLSSPKLSNVDYSSAESEESVDEELAELLEQKLSFQDSEFSTPQISRGHPIASHMFLTGSEPTKLDYDVMLALNDSQDPVDSAVFPHIAKWLDVVHTYSEKEQKMWRTPIRVEGSDGVGHWKSPSRSHSSKHRSLTASMPHPQVTPQRQQFPTSSLVYSSSPSYPVKQAPKKLFPPTSSIPKLDLEHH